MINKKLVKIVPDATPHIAKNVICQVIGLMANIVLMISVSLIFNLVINTKAVFSTVLPHVLVITICIAVKVTAIFLASEQSYLASRSVKDILRGRIYDIVIRLGSRYTKKLSTAELLQMSVEGVEQLETYFGNFLPQFFYSVISPLILFCVVAFFNIKIAVVLFICVPLIPISIILIQRFAKKLLAKYWGEYLGLGDNFLENIQGLNTLKIYSSDAHKHKQMNRQAERFRIVTMKVLTMQLNSIIVMDVIAYGGAALGIIFALLEFSAGRLELVGLFAVILLCADFFLPLRILGSFFHIAMNGVAASKKIFSLLEIEEAEQKKGCINNTDINMSGLDFAYDEKNILKDINIHIPKNRFISIVGKSGCGKSTIAGILAGVNENYTGNATIGGVELCDINKENLRQHITLISANSYIFKGSVRENLMMARNDATEQDLWDALDRVNLSEFLKTEKGLDTLLLERGGNLSGGQCQRLAFARALLHESDVYIFDEATSNIDVESENDIMEVVKGLSVDKTVLLISHRLANVVNSDTIYLLDDGKVVEVGTHYDLLSKGGYYRELWDTQQNLEEITGVTAR